MRTATVAVILVVVVLLAGCGSPTEPPEDAEGNETTTTFTENERGAHPDAPANDTQNETATGDGTAGDANGTDSTTTAAASRDVRGLPVVERR